MESEWKFEGYSEREVPMSNTTNKGREHTILVDGVPTKVSREVYEIAKNKELERQIERQRELNHYGFTEEDQAVYDALIAQMGD